MPELKPEGFLKSEIEITVEKTLSAGYRLVQEEGFIKHFDWTLQMW